MANTRPAAARFLNSPHRRSAHTTPPSDPGLPIADSVDILRGALRVSGAAATVMNLRSSPEIVGLADAVVWLPIEAVVVPGFALPA